MSEDTWYSAPAPQAGHRLRRESQSSVRTRPSPGPSCPPPHSQARKRCRSRAAGSVPRCHLGLSLAGGRRPHPAVAGAVSWESAWLCSKQPRCLLSPPQPQDRRPEQAQAGCGPPSTTPTPRAPGRDHRGGAAATVDTALHIAMAPAGPALGRGARESPQERAGALRAGEAREPQEAGPRLSQARAHRDMGPIGTWPADSLP